MLVSQSDIRNRIEELKLSYGGYTRQLNRLDITDERCERLEIETGFLQEEIATLEKLAQLVRIEPDRSKVEASVRERLDAIRHRVSEDPSLAEFTQEERDQSSGESLALLWALGEDRLTQNARFLIQGHEHADPSRTDRMVPGILLHTLESGPNPDARANAAYDLGKLGVAQAIPNLAAALDDEPIVAEMALRSLRLFTDDQLEQAGLTKETLLRIKQAADDQ